MFWFLVLLPGMVFGSVATDRMAKEKGDAEARRRKAEWQSGEVRRRSNKVKRDAEKRRKVARYRSDEVRRRMKKGERRR